MKILEPFKQKNTKAFSTRRKVVIISAVFSLLFFILVTPISTFIYNLVTPPQELKNITVTRTKSFTGEEVVDELEITWEELATLDITSIVFNIANLETGEQYYSEKLTKNLLTENHLEVSNIPQGVPVELDIVIRDVVGLKKNTTIILDDLNDEQGKELFSKVTTENRVEEVNIFFSENVIKVVFLSILLFVGTLWIIQFKFLTIKRFIISIYPSIVSLPFVYLSIGFLDNDLITIELIAAFVGSLLIFVFEYLLLLTVNILYASIQEDLPLAQAAKASQFVFSLISAYIIFVIFFGNVENILLKMLIITVSLFYFSFSSLIFQTEEVDTGVVLAKTFSISLTMAFAIFVFATWPVNYIFAMLASAIIYYVLLNVSLEVRYKISQYVWGEYIVLVMLVLALLFINSNWGINGTLF